MSAFAGGTVPRLPSRPVAQNPPPDLELSPLDGQPRTLQQLLTTFHLLFVAVDPFANESAWILPTSVRVLHSFSEADCRVAFLVTGTPDECRMFLGPWSQQVLTFADPDRAAVKAFGFERLPAIAHVALDGTVVNAYEGWDVAGWRSVTEPLARIMAWTAPDLPQPTDPQPFEGSPATV